MAAPAAFRALSIPAEVVEFILLGPEDDHRQLQDSPILGDVWLEYAKAPEETQDLLITPHRAATAARVAKEVSGRLGDVARSEAKLAFLQGIVAVRVSFPDLLQALVPLTDWWHKRKIARQLADKFSDLAVLTNRIKGLLGLTALSLSKLPLSAETAEPSNRFDATERFLALSALLLWAARQQAGRLQSIEALLRRAISDVETIVGSLLDSMPRVDEVSEPLIFQISLNRRATPALEHSVPAVKADAARTLFRVACDKIAWAVLDSGIDQEHQAFLGADGKARVDATYDFSSIRDIVSIDRSEEDLKHVKEKLVRNTGLSEAEVAAHLVALGADAAEERPVNWGVVERLVKLVKPETPTSVHGTHVAGIIGAKVPAGQERQYADGMCPDIRLYDFRVLSTTIERTEFAIIAALQYIRWLNQQHSYVKVHGANLSLSIPHSVRNYACGYTPICLECERLVESGVTVVTAAGNRGYHKLKLEDGFYESYAAFSITDPGNADGVITVGATHPRAPHNYGVSYFSSRGPTGDGRLKPDLVAPGERIQSPIPGNEWGEDSGTSMAAPHVSGAAAMLMARYSELIGQPRRIKNILCESATDLGRERSFQGHGMLDVLRAFQRI
jgi:hypothetical protein